MNDQQFFDRSVAHLRKQGRKAEIRTNGFKGACAYRGENGTACAIGGLLPDDLAQRVVKLGMNHHIIDAVRDAIPEVDQLFDGVNRYLIHWMQQTHDHRPVEQWESRFRQASTEFRVTYTPPEAP